MWFFTKDGAYGKRTPESDELYCDKNLGWMAIPTWSWTDSMWETIHSATNADRYAMASHLGMGIHNWLTRDDDEQCEMCCLTREQVGVKLLTLQQKQELMEEEYYNA